MPLSPALAVMPTRAPDVPCQRIPSINDISLLREYNAKYLGFMDYNGHQVALGKAFFAPYLSLAPTHNDISICRTHGRAPCEAPPTPNALMT